MSTYKGFTTVELRKPKRSLFDLSHEKRLSSRMGKLTPVFISETIPNDTFRVNTEVMLRLAPMLAPIMHRVNVYVHFFFVPNRLLWEDWEDFITGGRLGAEVTTPPVPPYWKLSDMQTIPPGESMFAVGQLADYLGIPPMMEDTGTNGDARLNVMPFAAYYKCWYDYYRDRNFWADNELLPMASGDNATANLDDFCYIKYRCWEHDYFTSALPWTQRGSEVLMPMEGDVTYKNISNIYRADGSAPTNPEWAVRTGDAGNTDEISVDWAGPGDHHPARIENIEAIENTSISINDLRRAVRLQEWLERNALAGSRYNESIMAHFGRRTSDSRLQRAEYLGGGKVAVKISEVITTAFSQDSEANIVPPGNMQGHGLTFGNTNQFTYNCEEHGFVVGIMSVLPTSGYMQGLPRMFRHRQTFLDYPWPSFAHLGEQEVFKSEIYADENNVTPVVDDEPVFGYQSRYADWKYIPSSSHGDFRESLDFWHLTRKFSSSPTLSAGFNQFEDALQNRVFAVSDSDTLWCYIYNQVTVKRSLPYFGTPML